MKNVKTLSTPKDTLIRMQVVHLGKILFNLQFVVVAIMLASILTFIFPAIYYLMLICAAFLSLFLLFANPTFMSMWSGGDNLLKVADILAQSWRYTVPTVFALAIAAIVCLSFDKNHKHPARIIVSVIVCGLAGVTLLAKLINKGGF